MPKDRPCVVVFCVEDMDGDQVATVAPITHSAPTDASRAIQLTAATRRRLGLDEETNWVVASEVNSFCWPGPDLAPTPTGQYAYGELPAVVFEALKQNAALGIDLSGSGSTNRITEAGRFGLLRWEAANPRSPKGQLPIMRMENH